MLLPGPICVAVVRSAQAVAWLTRRRLVQRDCRRLSTIHQAISSTPPRLDVGVFDSTHGWLRIRAELDARGQVNASLTAASARPMSRCGAALPEMTSYLASESVNVSRIAVHRVAEARLRSAPADGHVAGEWRRTRNRQMGDQGTAGRGR